MSSATNKKINQGQLIKLLETLSYTLVRTNGQHLIYRHSDSKSLIALRHARKNEIIPAFILASVLRNISDNGILTKPELDELLSTL